MLGHLGMTSAVTFIIVHLMRRKGWLVQIDYRYLLAGAILPDLADKIIGHVVFANTINNGRLVAHTFVFALSLFAIASSLRSSCLMILTAGVLFHHIEDLPCADARRACAGAVFCY